MNIIINVSFILHGEYYRVMRLLIIVIITQLSLSSSGLTCCRRGFHAHGLVGCSRRPSRGRTSCQVLHDLKYSYCSHRVSTVKIYRGHNIQEVRSATRSLWEPWKRWLVTSCDIESSRAWATCKVPHGYLDHHNAATDDDDCMFFPTWLIRPMR